MPSVNSLIYIRNALSNGQSANAAYRAMRQAAQDQTEATGVQWTGMRRQTFLRLYSQTLAARNKVGAALDYDPDLIPDATVITPRTSLSGEGYLTWLTIYTRQIGTSDVDTQLFAIRSDEPITPSEAMQRAKEGFDQSQADVHGTYRGHQFVGSTYSGTQQLIRE